MYLEKYNDPKTNIGTYIKEILTIIQLNFGNTQVNELNPQDSISDVQFR